MKACRFTVELSSDDARKRGELFKRFAEFINAHPEWWDELNVSFRHDDGGQLLAPEEESALSWLPVRRLLRLEGKAMKTCRFTVELSSDDSNKRGELFKR